MPSWLRRSSYYIFCNVHQSGDQASHFGLQNLNLHIKKWKQPSLPTLCSLTVGSKHAKKVTNKKLWHILSFSDMGRTTSVVSIGMQILVPIRVHWCARSGACLIPSMTPAPLPGFGNSIQEIGQGPCVPHSAQDCWKTTGTLGWEYNPSHGP